MDRKFELEILARSMAAMQRGQLAMRREEAIELIQELTELRGRHEALCEALRRLVDEAHQLERFWDEVRPAVDP